jgi:hypothetical protein
MKQLLFVMYMINDNDATLICDTGCQTKTALENVTLHN